MARWKWLVAGVVMTIGAACEPVPVEEGADPNEVPGIERLVPPTTAPADSGEPTTIVDTPVQPETTVPEDAAVSAPGALAPTRLIYSAERDGVEYGLLDGATITGPFAVRLELEADIGVIDRVEWLIDGVLFRSDDKDPPYNLRYSGLIPVDEPFGSDQGLDGVWKLEPQERYQLVARIVRGDDVTEIAATFMVDPAGFGAAPTTTTTAAPAPTTSAPGATTTTTAAPATTTTTAAPAPTTTVPTTTTIVPGGVTDWSNAVASIPAGFPTAETTGFAGAGYSVADLTPAGSLDIREDGAVIELLDINGRVRVFADNVTIRYSRIRHASAYGIDVQAGSTGLVIEDTTVIGTANTAAANIGLGNYTCRRCDLSQAVDGVKLGSNVTIEDSYIHDMRKFSGTHNDGMQNSGGGHDVLISGNTILGPYRTSTSAIIAQTNVGTIDNMVVTGNYMYGGSYTVYLRDKGSGNGPPTNSAVTNNVFAPYTSGVFAACLNNSGDAEACNTKGNTVSLAGQVTWSGNVFANGQSF
ncbi:MAG: right-handed parallel beta-helix repeat-containing protein [Actinomycetota bacterium]